MNGTGYIPEPVLGHLLPYLLARSSEHEKDKLNPVVTVFFCLLVCLFVDTSILQLILKVCVVITHE